MKPLRFIDMVTIFLIVCCLVWCDHHTGPNYRAEQVLTTMVDRWNDGDHAGAIRLLEENSDHQWEQGSSSSE